MQPPRRRCRSKPAREEESASAGGKLSGDAPVEGLAGTAVQSRNLAVQGNGASDIGKSVDPLGHGFGSVVVGHVEDLDHPSSLQHCATVVQGLIAAKLGIVQACGGDGLQHVVQRLVAKETDRFGGFPSAVAYAISDDARGFRFDAPTAPGDENHTEVVGAGAGGDQSILEPADAADLYGGLSH